eukprot:1671502-Pyramimonas_sp.AAC.1
MGNVFLKFCMMTESLLFLFIEHTLEEEWQERWRSYETWTENPNNDNNQPPPGTPQELGDGTTPRPLPKPLGTPESTQKDSIT